MTFGPAHFHLFNYIEIIGLFTVHHHYYHSLLYLIFFQILMDSRSSLHKKFCIRLGKATGVHITRCTKSFKYARTYVNKPLKKRDVK